MKNICFFCLIEIAALLLLFKFTLVSCSLEITVYEAGEEAIAELEDLSGPHRKCFSEDASDLTADIQNQAREGGYDVIYARNTAGKLVGYFWTKLASFKKKDGAIASLLEIWNVCLIDDSRQKGYNYSMLRDGLKKVAQKKGLDDKTVYALTTAPKTEKFIAAFITYYRLGFGAHIEPCNSSNPFKELKQKAEILLQPHGRTNIFDFEKSNYLLKLKKADYDRICMYTTKLEPIAALPISLARIFLLDAQIPAEASDVEIRKYLNEAPILINTIKTEKLQQLISDDAEFCLFFRNLGSVPLEILEGMSQDCFDKIALKDPDGKWTGFEEEPSKIQSVSAEFFKDLTADQVRNMNAVLLFVTESQLKSISLDDNGRVTQLCKLFRAPLYFEMIRAKRAALLALCPFLPPDGSSSSSSPLVNASPKPGVSNSIEPPQPVPSAAFKFETNRLGDLLFLIFIFHVVWLVLEGLFLQ